jgi:preprotein translocase subunit SecE
MDKAQGVDPKRIVVLFFIGAAVFAGMFVERLLRLVFDYARINDATLYGDWTISTVLGFAVAVVAGLVAWKTPKIQTVSLEIAGELKKVTWPTMRETRAATIAVVVATFVAAVLLGVFDYVWARVTELIY